jgi:hypothetical protein
MQLQLRFQVLLSGLGFLVCLRRAEAFSAGGAGSGRLFLSLPDHQ